MPSARRCSAIRPRERSLTLQRHRFHQRMNEFCRGLVAHLQWDGGGGFETLAMVMSVSLHFDEFAHRKIGLILAENLNAREDAHRRYRRLRHDGRRFRRGAARHVDIQGQTSWSCCRGLAVVVGVVAADRGRRASSRSLVLSSIVSAADLFAGTEARTMAATRLAVGDRFEGCKSNRFPDDLAARKFANDPRRPGLQFWRSGCPSPIPIFAEAADGKQEETPSGGWLLVS